MKKTQIYEWHKREGTIRVNVVEVSKIKREKMFSRNASKSFTNISKSMPLKKLPLRKYYVNRCKDTYSYVN